MSELDHALVKTYISPAGPMSGSTNHPVAFESVHPEGVGNPGEPIPEDSIEHNATSRSPACGATEKSPWATVMVPSVAVLREEPLTVGVSRVPGVAGLRTPANPRALAFGSTPVKDPAPVRFFATCLLCDPTKERPPVRALARNLPADKLPV